MERKSLRTATPKSCGTWARRSQPGFPLHHDFELSYISAYALLVTVIPLGSFPTMNPAAKAILAYGTLACFLLFFFSDGIRWSTGASPSPLDVDLSEDLVAFPDFGNYRDLRTLDEKEFPIDDRQRRGAFGRALLRCLALTRI